MVNRKNYSISPCRGKLGVLLPGMGAVSSTFIAGVELHKKKPGPMVGSITQMQTIRLGKRVKVKTTARSK
ncbi:MAG: inositol-3-phosphate synthase [Elusimicrobiota bacterium]